MAGGRGGAGDDDQRGGGLPLAPGPGGQGPGDAGDAHRRRQIEPGASADCRGETVRGEAVTAIRMAALACGVCATLWAQQFKFNLDHLAAKAAGSVDVSLNSDMLQFAGKFLNSGNPDEAKAKKLIGGLEGIYVKRFEFKNDGAWSQA